MKNLEQRPGAIGRGARNALQKCMLILVTTLLLLGAAPVSAEEKSAGETEFGFEAYLWMATIRGNTVTDDRIMWNFETIVKDLDMTAMLRGTVQKDRLFGQADLVYLGIGAKERKDGEFLGQPVEGKLSVALDAWIATLVGGYYIIDNGDDKFGLFGGARYLDISINTTIKLEDNKDKEKFEDSVWDGVIGVRGRHNYADGHYLRYYGDVGGGDSKVTWMAVAEFAYDFKKFTGVAGYRYLKWNFKNDSKSLDDLAVHGPYVGAQWTW